MFEIIILCHLILSIVAQDISVLYHNLNTDVILENNKWKDECSQNALKQLPSQCSQGIETLSPSQQKEIALELSICEFENAGIDYPLNCNEQIRKLSIDQCIKSLENSPQFWTTYSGNYRNIKDICHQISLPFEKDQILEVYRNITNVYQNVMDDLQKSHQYNKDIQDHIEKKFDKIFKVVDQVMKDKEKEKSEMNKTYNIFHENFELSMKKALVVIGNSYDGVNTNINEMSAHLNYFSNELLNVYKLIQQEREELELQQFSIINNNKQILNQQESVMDQISAIKKETKDLQDSSNNLGNTINSSLSFSSFQLNAFNSLLSQNIDDLQSQKLIIKDHSMHVINDISQLLIEYLNNSSQTILDSFELALQDSLHNLDTKIMNTEKSIALVNGRIEAFLGIISSSTKFLTSIPQRVLRFVPIFSVFGILLKILLVLVVYWIMLSLKPFWKVLKLIIRGSSTLVLPSLIGVVAATISLKLIYSLRVINSIE
ncbi:KAR5 [Candida jiufengensis]|uniref:KAR5 n=1 Tax=Candida jiufengensis TaxID=497108 RepID=UPI0022258BA1|nr:KAR5 [Candida jiufengensis]KAI5956755.1 KAR5 [Candida jiufengensis]